MREFVKWINMRLPLQYICGKNYFVPKNLNFMYCFGAITVLVLINQLLTGLWLSMFYTPTTHDAFASIQLIMRDVNYGWLFRYMHTTGASALYIVIYLHIFRGILYGSYQKPRELVWVLGMFLFVVIMAESSFGYLLPWGQMSYWSMQVITSLLSVIPYVGEKLVIWARGDFVVSGVTLLRCYALHIVGLPLLIFLLIMLHIKSLHYVGSNNPQGIDIKKLDDDAKNPDMRAFYPFYMFKDLLAMLIFLVGFFLVVFFVPDMRGYFIEVNNYTIANTMQSPEDIRPLWYLMPFYGILKVIPNKTLGVVLMMSAILLLFFLPWLDKSPVRAMRYKGIYSRIGFVSLLSSFILLGYFSIQALNPINMLLARICIVVYFFSILLMPVYTRFEKHLHPPLSISG